MVLKALICGGGNGAHVLAGLANAQPDTDCRVLTLYADEAERWTNAMKGGDFVITVHDPASGQPPKDVKGKPAVVTKNPADVGAWADIIIITVPAFAHIQYLEALKPYLQPGTTIVGLPGQAGWEFAVRGILGDLAKKCTVMSFESLPWACRISEFGKGATVLGTKEVLLGGVQVGNPAPRMDPTAMLQQCHGEKPNFYTQGHLLGLTLMGVNAYVHPCIMYGRWSKWDGKPCDEPPLFYNGLDEFGAGILSGVGDEIVAIAKGIMQQRPNVDLNNVSHIYQWYLRCYKNDIEDPTNLYTSIRTNRSYKGLVHPTKKTDDGKYLPNFEYRYLTEDIPFGLAVMRDVAEIANIPTPNIDVVLTWAQERMGKEYLVNGKMNGKDMGETRSAYRFGLKTLDAVLGL